MRRFVATVCIGGAILMPSTALAVPTFCDSQNPEIGCQVDVGGGEGGNDQPSPDPNLPPQPVCEWVPVGYSQLGAGAGLDANSQFDDGPTYFALPNRGAARVLPDGSTQRAEQRVCDDGTVGPLTWRTTTSMLDLITGSTTRVTRQIPIPTLSVNPAPEDGGYVNVGMWLAIANGESISVTASAGGMSATATATLSETEWTMGNGDVVTCDGPGTPLIEGDPGWDSAEQGPCGYTYTEVPTAEPYVVTLAATWTVTWETSADTSGTSPPITRTTTFDYQVREIQTVGVSG